MQVEENAVEYVAYARFMLINYRGLAVCNECQNMFVGCVSFSCLNRPNYCLFSISGHGLRRL